MSLKSAREAAGLSQSQLAQQSGMSASSIKSIEQGLRDPKKVSSETVANVAAVLDVPEWVIRQSNSDPVFEFLDGLIIVDEVAFDPSSRDCTYFRVGDDWFSIKNAVTRTQPPQRYHGSTGDFWRNEYACNYEYQARGLVLRGVTSGFDCSATHRTCNYTTAVV